MCEVVDITKRTSRKQLAKELSTPFNLGIELQKDIDLLSETLDITEEEALKVAENFYRRYPVLMEYVRSGDTTMWR